MLAKVRNNENRGTKKPLLNKQNCYFLTVVDICAIHLNQCYLSRS